jgi:hypothetical protein
MGMRFYNAGWINLKAGDSWRGSNWGYRRKGMYWSTLLFTREAQ